MLKITAKVDTWLKIGDHPKDSTQLSDSQKNFVPKGKSWGVESVLKEEKGHTLIKLAYGAGTRWVFTQHFNGFEPEPDTSSVTGWFTPENLKLIMPHASMSDINTYCGPINRVCAKFGIDDNKLRAAAFIAQIAHESGSLRYKREIASGAAYEGRRDLGNTQPGDGRRFAGRG